MPWVKIDDQFADHPKVRQLGPLSVVLQVRALCYVARYLTDGFIPSRVAYDFTSDFDLLRDDNGADPVDGRSSDWLIGPDDMVKAGLWEAVANGVANGVAKGYQIHDYLKYNPSRKEALKLRKMRARAGMEGGKAKARNHLSAKQTASKILAKSCPVPVPVPLIESNTIWETEFEKTWAEYPRRAGSNPKRDAMKCWNARREEGVSVEAMHTGVLKYAVWCSGTGKIGTEMVMQGRRFFGPARPFEETWDLPLAVPDSKTLAEDLAIIARANADHGKYIT